MEALKGIGTYEVKVSGVVFELKHRTTALMLQLGDVRQVFGLLSGGGERTPEQRQEDTAAHIERSVIMEGNICKVALVAIAGVPFVHGDRDWPELDPVTGPLLKSFLGSGLSVDPMPNSCTAPAESG